MPIRRMRTLLHAACLATLLAAPAIATAKPGNGKGNGGGGEQPAAPPLLSFTADRTEVPLGGSVRLSWASVNTRHCFASGGWAGKVGTEGVHTTGALTAPTQFVLECKDSGTSITASVDVTISAATEVTPAPEPAPEPEPVPEPEPTPTPAPTIDLRAADTVVSRGGVTNVSWESTDAQSCTASGGWSGSRAPSGSERVGPIDQATTYSLNCSGEGGNAVAMISVSINDSVTLSWQAPTENADGSPLTNLAGYRIYYGTTSGSYQTSVPLESATATSHALTLTSGDYYFAMTAVNSTGTESGYSNEVIRTVP